MLLLCKKRISTIDRCRSNGSRTTADRRRVVQVPSTILMHRGNFPVLENSLKVKGKLRSRRQSPLADIGGVIVVLFSVAARTESLSPRSPFTF